MVTIPTLWTLVLLSGSLSTPVSNPVTIAGTFNTASECQMISKQIQKTSDNYTHGFCIKSPHAEISVSSAKVLGDK